MRKDLVIGIGIGVPVVIFMILIGGGGHTPSIDFEDDTPVKPKQIETKTSQPTLSQSTSTTINPNCDSSYPDLCILPYPPDLDCGEIQFSNFRVIQPDPHGFDTDYDGIGCEVGSPQSSNPVESTPECDDSYPDVCITPYPPDLDCGEIGYSNFRVIGNDPHGFDRDNDGIGCES